jgi:parallel beta-helix repeat protein
MNRYLSILLLLLPALKGSAATYYFSSSGGDDARTSTQAQNVTTPWKTLAKASAMLGTAAPGDQFLFLRGDTFTGTLVLSGVSGTSTSPITLGAYGTASARPVFSGLTTLGGWTALGGGVWESSADPALGTSLSTVLVNGAMTPMGRYPNADAANGGYIPYQSGTSTSVTSSTIAGIPNFVGAELVVRLNRFYTDRCLITGQTTTTVTYTSQSGSTPTAGFGLFFQNSPLTLDQPGEWWYDATNKKLRMYMGTSAAGFTVQASTTDTLIRASSASWVTLDNLRLEGANGIAAAVSGGTGFHVQHCDILYAGRDAVTINATSGFLLDQCTVSWCNSRGFNAFQSNSGAQTVTNSSFRNIGTFPGMGWKRAKDGVLVAIEVTSNGSVVRGNTVVNTGYIGIRFYGDNTLVENNTVDTFCFHKDDGAGIYTWNGNSVLHTGTIVRDNVVRNGIGAPNGGNSANPEAHGFYYDDQSNHIYTSGNSVYNCRKGLFLHSTADCRSERNTFTNCAYGYYAQWETGDQEMQNNDFVHNTVTSTTSAQLDVYLNFINSSTVVTRPQDLGRIDSNTYCRPVGRGDQHQHLQDGQPDACRQLLVHQLADDLPAGRALYQRLLPAGDATSGYAQLLLQRPDG